MNRIEHTFPCGIVKHARIETTSIYARDGYSLVPVTTWGPELKRKTCQETPKYGAKNQ